MIAIAQEGLNPVRVFHLHDDHGRVEVLLGGLLPEQGGVGIVLQVPGEGPSPVVGHFDLPLAHRTPRDLLDLPHGYLHAGGAVSIDQELLGGVVVDVVGHPTEPHGEKAEEDKSGDEDHPQGVPPSQAPYVADQDSR